MNRLMGERNMKKMLSIIILVVVLTTCISTTAFAYTGGPLDGTGINEYSGGVFFDDSTVVISEPVIKDALDITKDPGGENKKAGEECVFTASAVGADYVRWYIVTPKGETRLASEIPNLYKGTSVTGTQGDRLVITNVTSEMSGSRFFAAYTSGDLTMNTTTATLTVEGSVTPSATPVATPTPTPAPTPTVYNNTNSTGGVSGGGVSSDGGTGSSMLGTNTQNYNQNTSIGNADSAAEPASGSDFNAKIENTSTKSNHVGAYILAAVAGLVIIGSVLVMALYMKGKISLGKFEKFLGGSDGEAFDDDNYYDPDDYDDDDI